MSKFEEEIGYILANHRDGNINYREAITQIENLVIDCLGFGMAMSKRAKEIEDEVARRVKQESR